jgi:hypothetical protein
MISIIFAIFISRIDSLNDCDQMTRVLIQHGTDNNHNYFFVAQTYNSGDIKLTKASCTANIGANDFRTLINKKFPCNGCHCQDQASTPWGCIVGDSQNCYNVEHIIPLKHNISELQGCDVNIYGNLIMAYGLWNQQLSNSHYYEKKLIYHDIFNKAYQSIYWCCKNYLPNTIPVPSCKNNDTGMSTGLVVTLSMLFGVGLVFWLVIIACSKWPIDEFLI